MFFTFCQRGKSGEGNVLQTTKEESGVGWVTNLKKQYSFALLRKHIKINFISFTYYWI